MEFRIEHTWNSLPISHDPVMIKLTPENAGILMEVNAPFFNDPPAPPGELGKPFNGLWDYEVVEAFFLNGQTQQYLEVELCPHGQHLVLLLSGRRKVCKQELPLRFEVSRTSTKWNGKAHLPWSYFPPATDKFNAFAIHGSGVDRTYEALYPVPQHEIQKDQKPDLTDKHMSYHLILEELLQESIRVMQAKDLFQPETLILTTFATRWENKVTNVVLRSEYEVFSDNEQVFSRNKAREVEYKIENTWDSIPVMHVPVTIKFKPGDQGLVMEVSSLFFDDPPAPPGEPGEPFDGLWDYEVVESFFLNSTTKNYLEVELCPHGQHLVLRLSGGDCLEKGLPLSYQADINWGTWNGTAVIPWTYFPPGVDKMNSYAIHGSGIGRMYEALYPIPPEEIEEGQGPNFHRLEYFRDFSLNDLMGDDWKEPPSDLWPQL